MGRLEEKALLLSTTACWHFARPVLVVLRTPNHLHHLSTTAETNDLSTSVDLRGDRDQRRHSNFHAKLLDNVRVEKASEAEVEAGWQ